MLFNLKKVALINNNLKNMNHISIKWVSLVVIIIGAVFAFYWFSVRPAQIQKKCYQNPYPSYNECLVGNGLAI